MTSACGASERKVFTPANVRAALRSEQLSFIDIGSYRPSDRQPILVELTGIERQGDFDVDVFASTAFADVYVKRGVAPERAETRLLRRGNVVVYYSPKLPADVRRGLSRALNRLVAK